MSLTGAKSLWANFFPIILNQSHKRLLLHNGLSENFLLTRNFWPEKLFPTVWPTKAAFLHSKFCGLPIHLFGSYTPENKLINRPVLDQKNVFCCFSKIFTIKLIGSFLLLRKKIENWEIFVTATLLLWPGDQKLSKSKLYAVGKAPKWAPWAPWANIEIVGIYCFVSKKPEPSNLWALPNCCPIQSKMMNFWSKILLAKKSHCWNAGSNPCLLAILSASQANLCRSGF